MTVADLQNFYDYGDWANRKLLAVVSRLSEDEFTRPVGGSYGSVRNTLVHMMNAEWGWLDRCGGKKRGSRLDPNDYPTVESVVATWTDVASAVREFFSSLKDDDLERSISYAIEGVAEGSKTVGELMQHAIVHGIHHRGQVALLVRELGHAPGNFDLLFYEAPPVGA